MQVYLHVKDTEGSYKAERIITWWTSWIHTAYFILILRYEDGKISFPAKNIFLPWKESSLWDYRFGNQSGQLLFCALQTFLQLMSRTQNLLCLLLIWLEIKVLAEETRRREGSQGNRAKRLTKGRQESKMKRSWWWWRRSQDSLRDVRSFIFITRLIIPSFFLFLQSLLFLLCMKTVRQEMISSLSFPSPDSVETHAISLALLLLKLLISFFILWGCKGINSILVIITWHDCSHCLWSPGADHFPLTRMRLTNGCQSLLLPWRTTKILQS